MQGEFHLQSVTQILDEDFGGGYQENGSQLTHLDYNNFVDQIGTGTMGGVFEIFYLGQMTGRTIELIDGTHERNISMLHGNSKLDFPCLQSQTDSIQLKMTNSDGRNHFNLIRNGQTVDIKPHYSHYENRCLYEAFARALNINTDVLLKRSRNILRNNNVAREAFENGVGEIFDELRGGANSRHSSPNGKELKIKNPDRKNEGAYTQQTSEATVRQENLDQGTEVSYRVRNRIQEDL